MKQFTRLGRDTRPQAQPAGSYPYGKNGVQDYVQDSVYNELGFRLSAASIPYKPIGVLETDKYPIILSTDNTHSAIGFFNTDTDTYVPIVDDATLGYKLPFDSAHFITGQVQRNYKQELVGAFTDKNGVPYYFNFDNPEATVLNDIKLFPDAVPPDITTEVLSGGSLLPGAYYAIVKYLKADGSEIGWVAIAQPKIVTGDLNVATDKAIGIHITGIDTTYPKVQVGIISKINGVFKAIQFLNPLPVTGSLDTIYTGSELTEDITLEEVLTPRIVYDRVGTIGQLNDSLYIADLHTPPQLLMQRYASLVKVRWHSKPIVVEPVYQPMVDGSERSMMHEEVYALYIRYKQTNGNTTQLFPLMGELLISADRAASGPGTAEGLTAKKFQVEDTIPSFDFATRSGYCGKWENATETYPNDPQYDATSIGGIDHRGQKVRHFRMPSLNWCKQNLYAGEPSYGRNMLDMLGISVENIIIPSEYASQIVGYEIFFAKRNVLNSTVIGQSIMLMGQRRQTEPEFGATSYSSTGGNWESRIDFKNANDQALWQEQKIFHFYSFDMLFNKPSITPDYIGLKLKLKYPNMRNDAYAYVEDQEYSSANDAPIVFNLDYLERGAIPTVPFKFIKAVKNTTYVPNNINTGKWLNKGIETFFGGELSNPERLIPLGEIGTLAVQPNSKKDFTPRPFVPQDESCMLANMMAIRADLFNPVNGQTLVRMGQTIDLTANPVFYAGDTYICDYTFHTYGIFQWGDDQSDGSTYDSMSKGTRVARRFVCECAANLYARYEDPANQYSRYYPKSPLTPQDINAYLSKFLRNNDPNQFGYKKDSNALDDLVQGVVYNPFIEDITDHPFRIHRGGKLSRQTKVKTWRTFLPLDYYEAQKNMGAIIHLEGMDDRLIVHYENAMMLTQDKTKLESDIISVTLGSGDIFQFAPQEAHSDKLGYAGTQHELSCVRTPFGYVFVDSKSGQVFVYKGDLTILNKEMNTFFQEYLRVKETNPFTGNGYTLGYDEKYKRILLTAKNFSVDGLENPPVYTPELIPSLTIGDIVIKDGRYVRFMGVNSSGFNCHTPLTPNVTNFAVTIPENTPVGTVIGHITGTNVANYFITGPATPFSVAADGTITLAFPLNTPTTIVYHYNGNGYSIDNLVDAFTVDITVTTVNQAPKVQSNEVTINDTYVNGNAVATIVATDREGNTLTYSIIGGNTGPTFTINSATGAVTVSNATKLDGILIPRYELTVNVTDGTSNTTGTLVVNVTHIDKVPVVTDTVLSMLDTLPSGTTIGFGTQAVDPEGEAIVYTIVSQTDAAVMQISTTNLKVILVDHSLLDPATSYVFHLTAYDGIVGHAPVPFTVTVNVKYDRRNIRFAASNPSCVGSGLTCPPGYVLSPDGTTCTQVQTVAADIGAGSPITLQHYGNSDYARWGAIIYMLGQYGTNGAPSVKADTTLIDTTAPIYPYKPGGEPTTVNTLWTNTALSNLQNGVTGRLNRTGVWKNGAPTYNFAPLGFSRQFNVPTTGNYFIAMGSDNTGEIKINGVSVVNQNLSAINSAFNSLYAGGTGGAADLFRYWHIYQVALNAGVNIITVTGTNTTFAGIIGCEIYNATAAQLKAATTEAALQPYIIFSSAAPAVGSISNGDASDVGLYDCSSHPTYTLVYDPGTNSYSCKLITTTAPASGLNTRHWDKIDVWDVERNVLITQFTNTAGAQFFQDVLLPYYPDVVNSIDCGGSVILYLSVLADGDAQKNDCPDSLGTVINYALPAGKYGSVVDQATADNAAIADVAANKQAYANTNGTCS